MTKARKASFYVNQAALAFSVVTKNKILEHFNISLSDYCSNAHVVVLHCECTPL